MRTLPELAYLRIEQKKQKDRSCLKVGDATVGKTHLLSVACGFFPTDFSWNLVPVPIVPEVAVHQRFTPKEPHSHVGNLSIFCWICVSSYFQVACDENQWLMQSCKDWSGICNANCSSGCHLAFCILSLSAFQLMRNSRTFWNKTAWNGEIAKEGGTVKAQIWDTAGQERCSLWLWHMALRHGLFSWFFQLCLEKLEHLEHRYRAITSAHYRRAVETACFEGLKGCTKLLEWPELNRAGWSLVGVRHYQRRNIQKLYQMDGGEGASSWIKNLFWWRIDHRETGVSLPSILCSSLCWPLPWPGIGWKNPPPRPCSQSVINIHVVCDVW